MFKGSRVRLLKPSEKGSLTIETVKQGDIKQDLFCFRVRYTSQMVRLPPNKYNKASQVKVIIG